MPKRYTNTIIYKVIDVQGFFDIIGKFCNGKLISTYKQYNRRDVRSVYKR